MKKTKKAFYIVYCLEENNDLLNCYDSDSLKDCSKWLNIDYSNISKYVVKNINDLEKIRIKQLNEKYIEKNNYFIFKDYE